MGGEKRRAKSLRIGVHHANAVVWGPVYRTHRAASRAARLHAAATRREKFRSRVGRKTISRSASRVVLNRFRRASACSGGSGVGAPRVSAAHPGPRHQARQAAHMRRRPAIRTFISRVSRRRARARTTIRQPCSAGAAARVNARAAHASDRGGRRRAQRASRATVTARNAREPPPLARRRRFSPRRATKRTRRRTSRTRASRALAARSSRAPREQMPARDAQASVRLRADERDFFGVRAASSRRGGAPDGEAFSRDGNRSDVLGAQVARRGRARARARLSRRW